MGGEYDKVLVGQPERKIHLVRPRRRWEDNFIMNLEETGGEVVDWVQLAQDKAPYRGLFYTEILNFGLHKRQGISLPTE